MDGYKGNDPKWKKPLTGYKPDDSIYSLMKRQNGESGEQASVARGYRWYIFMEVDVTNLQYKDTYDERSIQYCNCGSGHTNLHCDKLHRTNIHTNEYKENKQVGDITVHILILAGIAYC